MATQFLQGVESAYINGVMVVTTEEVSYTVPQELYDFAESNQGPLDDVLKWNKEAGGVGLTLVHTAGLDYVDMFADVSSFTVVINLRCGDSLVSTKGILAELPNHSAVAGTTEVRFKSMNVTLNKAA